MSSRLYICYTFEESTDHIAHFVDIFSIIRKNEHSFVLSILQGLYRKIPLRKPG